MESQPLMGLDEFKQAVGKYWHANLKKVNPEYRKIIADAICKVAKTNEPAANGLAKKTWWIVKNIMRIDERCVPKAYGLVNLVAEEDAFSANILAMTYPLILSYITKINKDYGRVIFDYANDLGEKNAKVGAVLVSKSAEILQAKGLRGYDAVYRAAYKLVDKDKTAAYLLVERAAEILEGIDRAKEINADVFLIESIRDTKDAHVISQLIDMKKYQDQYNEKVAGFY